MARPTVDLGTSEIQDINFTASGYVGEILIERKLYVHTQPINGAVVYFTSRGMSAFVLRCV